MIIHYPCPELKIEWAPDETSFRIMLPWIQTDIDVVFEERTWIKLATLYLHHTPHHPLVQHFLGSLSSLPIAFQKKTSWVLSDKISVNFSKDMLQYLSPKGFLDFMNISANYELPHIFKDWTWDLEVVLNKTYLADLGAYDPVASLTLGLLFSWQKDAQMHYALWGLPKALDLIRLQNESLFFDHMSLLLKSTLFITRQVPPLLIKAQEIFPAAQEVLQHFYLEELGHDRLMEKALKVLGSPIQDSFKIPEPLVLLMKLFEYTVNYSPLALTAFISLFEGRIYPDLDPLAKIIEKSSKPKAARGYAQHFHINKSHNHNNEAWKLMDLLPLQSEGEVIFMLRILELASHLIAALDHYFFTSAMETLDGLKTSEGLMQKGET